MLNSTLDTATDTIYSSVSADNMATSTNNNINIPQWMIEIHHTRKKLFLKVVEPIIVFLLGPTDQQYYTNYYEDGIVNNSSGYTSTGEYYNSDEFTTTTSIINNNEQHISSTHRRLGFLPSYVEDVSYLRASSMSFATLTMMYLIMSVILLVFLSCFYHNQKTSPLFVSPRRHRLPKLVPPPLPVDGAFSWVNVCLFMSDEEVRCYICFISLIGVLLNCTFGSHFAHRLQQNTSHAPTYKLNT